jgi:hypothetical protein
MGRYMAALETADRQEGELAQAKYVRLQEKIAALREQMAAFKALDAENRNQPLRRSSDAPPQPRSHTASATSGRLDQSVFERVYVGTLAAARRTAPALPQTSGSDWTHNSPVTKYQDTLTPPCPSIVGRRDDDGWMYLLPQPKRLICKIAESVRSLPGFINRGITGRLFRSIRAPSDDAERATSKRLDYSNHCCCPVRSSTATPVGLIASAQFHGSGCAF